MSEQEQTPREILQAWIGMGEFPSREEMSLVTLAKVREAIRAVLAEVERLRDIISPGDAAAYEQGMAALQARAERAEAALMDALHDCALTYDAAGDLDYLSRAVEAEAALRWCDEFAPGIVEQARAALRDPAPLPTSQPARAIEVCKRAATAPAEGFFARGDDGHYRTDPAPACACGIPGAGKARECHGDYYGGETFAMDPGGEFKETNVCKCGCHRDSAPAEEP